MKTTATTVAAALLVAAGLTACAQRPVPLASSYPASEQQKMQATHHWDVLAESLAAGIQAKLPANRPVYIVPPSQNTAFGKALHTLLTRYLVEKGVSVSVTDPADTPCCNTLRLKYDSQVVNFDDREGLRQLPSDFTLMKAASYLIYRVGDLWATPAWAILPMSSYQEAYFPAGTNSEVIVSLSVEDGPRVIHSDSRTYYINGAEQDHYSHPGVLPPVPHTKQYRMIDQ